MILGLEQSYVRPDRLFVPVDNENVYLDIDQWHIHSRTHVIAEINCSADQERTAIDTTMHSIPS
jgi:hypothetical protein